MQSRAQRQRNERIEAVARHLGVRVGPDEAAELDLFVRRYFARVTPEDVLTPSIEDLSGAAAGLWRFGAVRRPHEVLIRIFNPKPETHGWVSRHSVAEIVQDDRPFLVDSVAAALTRRGLVVHALVHPALAVRRDASGHRVGVDEIAPAKPAGRSKRRAGAGAPVAESMMHVEFDQQTDPATLHEIEAELVGVLADVRAATEDWRAMLGKLAECVVDLDERPPPLHEEEISEGKALLQWMADNHFTLLGYREYAYSRAEGEDALSIIHGSGLGILREPSRRIMRMAGTNQSAADMAPEVREFLHRPELLIILKANERATVHRPVHLDYVAVKRFDDQGQVVGERRFVGLFTSNVYSGSVRDIPYLRRKVRRIVERAGITPDSHDGKALQNILDTYPRDELFQIGEDDLFHNAIAILALQERPRIRLFVRRDRFQRFVSCLVYAPRERFSTELRKKLEAILATAFAGRVSAHYTQISDEPLARVLVIIATQPGKVPDSDIDQLQATLIEASRTWSDRLSEALTAQYGEAQGNALWRRYAEAFSAGYQERFDIATALADIEVIERVAAEGVLGLDLYKPADAAGAALGFKLYHRGAPVPLSDVLPLLENMGLRVLEEHPFEVRPAGAADAVWLHDFGCHESVGLAPDLARVKPLFESAFAQVWSGAAASDGFNRLVLRAGLDMREVIVLRAVAKYLRQAGIAFSHEYMESTLGNHPKVARLLTDLFHAEFDPVLTEREQHVGAVSAAIESALDSVSSLDEDRILRRFLNVFRAMLRTNYFQHGSGNTPKPYLSFKLDSGQLADLPSPRPYREIFVYGPKVEALHLRGGRVARGGIRWSDRREDFRTEVLGLLKAQMVKNAVIVPVGAKGGFVPTRPPPPGSAREAIVTDAVESYKTFISGLLDITDNRVGADVVPPQRVVRRDGDDPYLVVAADKGTATFSDIANGLAVARGFWLGDAFASGGSAGYDHKKMGITARGAWELVKRHFRELGKNIQAEDFTVIGIGDMSGDVFGNGMLLSPRIRLLAAFDHRHIFIDPEPDAATSFAERRRLFDLPRSSWGDYNAKLVSPGGGIFDRKAKSVKLSAAIRGRFGIQAESVTPAELIRALLTADTELLWFGGIGTYVKAANESHADADDRANDALRVNGRDIRARVIGEGANLGCTQRGRIEYALAGGRLNTDAVDNSAGVDCSDHEVNIKIALDPLVADRRLEPQARADLLATMTEDVAELVLRDNYLQGQTVSTASAEGVSALEAQARFMRNQEKRGRLDRALESLPDEEALAERKAAGLGFTRPELAVLMAYAKTSLFEALLDSDLPDDAYYAADLASYFPRELRRNYRDAIEQHRLRREIVATSVANSVVNRGGIAFVDSLQEETRAKADDITRAYTIAREVFDLREMWRAIEGLDNKVAAAVQLRMLQAIRELHRRGTLWLLRSRGPRLPIAETIAEFGPGTRELAGMLGRLLADSAAAPIRQREQTLVAEGVPVALAEHIAELGPLGSAFDIVSSARAAALPVAEVSAVYFAIGARFGFDWLRAGAEAARPADYWDRLALAAIVEDLFGQQRALTGPVLRQANGAGGSDAVSAWVASHEAAVARIDQLIAEFRNQPALDLARLAIASRSLRDLVQGAA